MITKFILLAATLFFTCGTSPNNISQSAIQQDNLDNNFVNRKQIQSNKTKPSTKYKLASTPSRSETNIENLKTLPQKKEQEKIFHQIVQNAVERKLSNKSIGEIIQVVAENFLGAKYQAGLLDKNDREALVISLQEFDCLLFIETVLALSHNIALQEYNYQSFEKNIIDRRYWNGHLDGYCSRLHYFSEWVYDNQKRNNLDDISLSLGGIAQKKKLNFMSKHRQRYPLLIKNDANFQCITEMEINLANQGIPTNYIPKREIREIYNQLQPGDIIGVATNIAGLDVTHTGLVYHHSDGGFGFIHASPIGKVTIARDLQNYVENVANSTGILVARPIDPRTQKLN